MIEVWIVVIAAAAVVVVLFWLFAGRVAQSSVAGFRSCPVESVD